MSSIASAALSFAIASLGIVPSTALRFFVSKSLRRSWSATAVEATCTHLSQYHVIRNVLFMTMTEFKQISKQLPEVPLAIERHDNTQNFCCSEAGSAWVASRVAGFIKNKISSLSK